LEVDGIEPTGNVNRQSAAGEAEFAMAGGLFFAFALYFAVGIAVGLAFVLFGVTHSLSHSVSVTTGARILLLPGATLLWPLVLHRWLKSRRR
jgi:hypothetical protein